MPNDQDIKLLNTPQFMGRKGMTIQQVRSFIKKQKRMKGFEFSAPTGNSTFNIQLAGNAKLFLGLVLFGVPNLATYPNWNNFFDVTSMQLTINNDIMIEQLNPNFLTQQFTNEEYYYLPRPLNGQDTITMNFSNTGALVEVVNVGIYYI